MGKGRTGFFHYVCDEFTSPYRFIYGIGIRILENGKEEVFTIDGNTPEWKIIEKFRKFLKDNEIKNLIGWNVQRDIYGMPHIKSRSCNENFPKIKEIDLDNEIKFEESKILTFLGITKIKQLMILNNIDFHGDLYLSELLYAIRKGDISKIRVYISKRLRTLEKLHALLINNQLKTDKTPKFYLKGIWYYIPKLIFLIFHKFYNIVLYLLSKLISGKKL